MKPLERTMIGGASALLPLLSALYFNWNDPTSTAQKFFIQGGILFFAGCLMAYLHKKETSEFKILQIGLAIPSLLFSIQNGVSDKDRHDKIQLEQQVNTDHADGAKATVENPFIFSLFPSANAQEQSTVKRTNQYVLPKQSIRQALWQGVTGKTPENVWYVITSSHKDKDEAFRKADEINRSNKGLHAEVYDRYQGSPYYAVIIGSNLSVDDAKALRKKAKDVGISNDAYLWSLK